MGCISFERKYFVSESQFQLEPDLPAVVIGVDRLAAVVVGHVGLHFQAVSDDVAGDADGGLVPAFVSGERLHFALGEERRVAQGDLPFLVEQVAGLHVETLPAVYEGVAPGIEQRFVAAAAHEVGIECESPVFEDEVGEVGAQIAGRVVGHDGAALALQARSLVVVGVGSRQQDPDLFFAFEVAFEHVALRFEPPQRIEFQTPRVGQSSVRRTAPVAAFAQRYGAFGREVESVALTHVVFAEESEVAVEVEFAVDDAPVDELQGARRVGARPVGLDLGLAEPDVPFGTGHIVDDGVADDVHVAVGQRFGIVGGEAQLYGVNQFRGVDVSVETQSQTFYLRVGFGERKILVERQSHHVLHAEAHGQRKPVAFGTERDALAHFEVGHVAQTFQQFGVVVERIGGNDFGAPERRALLCCGERAAAGQQEQEECFFHFCLVCLFSFVRFPAKLQKICAFPVNLLQSWHVNLKRI